ncbi:MAG: hypothetical protein ABIN21_06280 [candidate division WOR-3 bacterium]
MRKILIYIFTLSFLYTEPYKPYPIIFIHGRSGSSETWGVKPDTKVIYEPFQSNFKIPYFNPSSDTIIKDSIIPGHTFEFFLNEMTPYCIVWDAIDKTYTKPGDTSLIIYPNKSFLEIFNADYPVGSIDEEAENDVFPPNYQKGWGYEIGERIEKVLKEYYGNNWQDNPNAKVIIIAYSMGAP